MNRTILLVEDDMVIALAERATLERNGYEVNVVTTGELAVAAVQEHRPFAVVLMDIDLGPGMNGIEATKQIIEISDVPVVFLTSHTEEDVVESVKSVVRYGYVVKTSGEFVLLQAVEMARELFLARKKLERSREEYRSIAQLVGEIIVRHDADGNWTFLNDAACEFFGMPEEELRKHHFMEFVHPEDREATEQAMEQMRTTLKPVYGFVKREQTPAGVRVIEWNRCPIIDENGTFAGHQSTGRDITERLPPTDS